MSDDEKKEKENEKESKGLGQELLEARTILVSEEVSDKLARRVTAEALVMDSKDDKSPITVYINSPGGSADSGFAIYDILRYIKAPVRTVVSGLCASAGVTIYLASPKERRFSTPNSRFLLHQPSSMAMGSASDIAITAEEIVKLRERYNQIVSDETGKSVEEITTDADRDFWLSPGQALEYGLVGKVVTSITELG